MTNEEAIKIIKSECYIANLLNLDRTRMVNTALDLAIKALEQQPKIGHWITTRTFMHDGEFYCDKCKCDSPNNEKWDYCPNCGAKMVEQPQESEDKE
jgi:hypothetical protein